MTTQAEESNFGTKIKLISDDYAYDKTVILGKGSTSTVYKGYNSSASQIIACKIIDQWYCKDQPIEIERELSILQKISENIHENIMGFYGYQLIPDGMCFLLEYCEKGNLTKFLKEQKISEKNGLSMIYQIVSGMEHFNSHLGEEILMHRDLKPDNIFLTGDLTIKIGDFGLSRQYTEVQKTAVKGTPLYAAPELDGKNHTYDARCDVWSVGLIVYEILTGKKLYSDVEDKNEIVNKLKLGEKIELPLQKYHKFWEYFLNLMLVYKSSSRKSFSQLRAILDENIEKIEEQIRKKYGHVQLQSVKAQSRNNSSSRLLSAIRPSRLLKASLSGLSNESKYSLQSIIRANDEEKSYNYLNRCQKFLTYWLEMSRIYYYPISIFNNNDGINDTFVWGNVYKYILMTLSLAAYFTKISKIVTQIKEKKVKVNQLVISKETIVQNHQQVFTKTLQSFHKDYEKLMKKYINMLQRQFIPKIQQYENRPQTREILQANPKILKFKEQIKKNQFRKDEIDYLKEYRAIINKEPIHMPMHIFSQLDQLYAKQYFKIRLVGYYRIMLHEENCHNSDYIIRKKEEIQKMSKDEALVFISRTYETPK